MANRVEKKQTHQLTLLKQRNPTLRVNKSRTIASMDLITQKGNTYIRKRPNSDGLICSRITTTAPPSEKKVTPQYNKDSDRVGTHRLVGRLQGRDKSAVVPNNTRDRRVSH